MTVFELCVRLGQMLPRDFVIDLKCKGILNTKQIHNQDVYIEPARLRNAIREEAEKLTARISSLHQVSELIQGLAEQQSRKQTLDHYKMGKGVNHESV